MSFYYDPEHGQQWIKEIAHRLEQEETEHRFLARGDFEFEREYRAYYMRRKAAKKAPPA